MQNSSESSEEGQLAQDSNKARKTQHGQSASGSGRIRRAARACNACRGSKLRCEPPEPGDIDTRCAHCAKVDQICTFDNPLPSHVVDRGRQVDEKDGRLAKLENNVARLLEMMEQRSRDPTAMQAEIPQPTNSEQYIPPPHPTQLSAQGASSMHVLAHAAQAADMPQSGFVDLESWTGGDGQDMTLFENPAPTSALASSDNFPALLPVPWPQTAPPRWNDLPGISTSPIAIVDTPQSLHSNKSSAHERHTSAQARPLPKYGTASRMAVFTDPLSHEAPFRSLTYNPDTYRNFEMADDDSITTAPTGKTGKDSGGKTPKRGIRDPIDNGIMSEAEAKALFSFFRDEISFFLPIFLEPMTFDTVRHRSSFLLSAILAVACKYCCGTNADNPGDPFGPEPTIQQVRHGVQPMDEEKWVSVRSWAMSSYFQALISKVHCLEDVQATLLLCAWGLQDRGASPDPWLMSGSAYRLSRRLGLHHAAVNLASGARPSGKLVASLKTYLCLYAFDRFVTVGFGRPETEGFDPASVDCSALMEYVQFGSSDIGLFCSQESAACVMAYVDLANIAKEYSRFVNVTLKADPKRCTEEMSDIGAMLDAFSSRWLWARSPLAPKLGLSARPLRMLYDHIRLCLHSVPLKAASHPESLSLLSKTGLDGVAGSTVLQKCLKKAEDSATGIIQAFADDSRDDSESAFCFAYDYIYMVISHSAATLLRLGTIEISGVDSPVPKGNARSRSGRIDRSAAMRYCGMAITSLVEMNRSANFFPCDMAGNLSQIAQETGMVLADWVSDSVVKATEARAAPPENEVNAFATASSGAPFPDANIFGDMAMFLQPGFFDDNSIFSGLS